MKRTAQVIDRFQSRGKLVLTLWDLASHRRFTIRIRSTADVDLGEVLQLHDDKPRVRRVFSDAIEGRWHHAAVLPIFGREPPHKAVDVDVVDASLDFEDRQQGYGKSVA